MASKEDLFDLVRSSADAVEAIRKAFLTARPRPLGRLALDELNAHIEEATRRAVPERTLLWIVKWLGVDFRAAGRAVGRCIA